MSADHTTPCAVCQHPLGEHSYFSRGHDYMCRHVYSPAFLFGKTVFCQCEGFKIWPGGALPRSSRA